MHYTTAAALAMFSLALHAIQLTAHAATIYVDDSAAGANTGASWDDAFVKLYHALAIAEGGDEIRIGQGTYKPNDPNGNPTATFLLVSNLLVRGGYAGVGAPNPDLFDPVAFPTILSGDLDGDDAADFANYGDNSYHVIVVKEDTVGTRLEGVTVRGGSASLNDGMHQSGGGVFCENASLTVRDCILEDNQAFRSGGGIYGFNSGGTSSLWLERCTIRRNRHMTPVGSGGGVLAAAGSTFIECTFESNHAPLAGSGAGLKTSGSLIDSCVFENNGAAEDGGAIFGGFNTIQHCEFRNNSSGVFGGAINGGMLTVINCIFEDNFSSYGGAINGSGIIRDCRFARNWAASMGGAIAGGGTVVNCEFLGNYGHPSGIGEGGALAGGGAFTNCLFSGNYASSMGGAALVIDATFTNCTFVGNRLTYTNVSSGAIHNWQNGDSRIENCIVYFNEANGPPILQAQITAQNGTVTVENSCVQGWDSSLPGQNNIGDNPLLLDADGADNQYGTSDDNSRLADSSPSRDTGSNDLVPADGLDLDSDGNTTELTPLDLDGLRRIVNGTVDMGAFEWQRVSGCESDIAPSEPGVAGDGTINVADLLMVIQHWGSCDQCVGDITGDGSVNVQDMLAVINDWGTCSMP